jgi:hypothetical protein
VGRAVILSDAFANALAGRNLGGLRTCNQTIIPPHTSKPPKRRRNYDFYYYEQVGSRIYFRMTWFGAIFFMLSMLIPPVCLVLYTYFSDKPASNMNVARPAVQATSGRLMTPEASPAHGKR